MINVVARDLWHEVEQKFRAERGAPAADLWLSQTRPLEFSRGLFVLGVPNAVVREWLDHRYRDDLERIFQQLTGSSVRVLLRIDPTRPIESRGEGVFPAELPDTANGHAAPSSASAATDDPEFVVRPENKLAYAAMQRVLTKPESGNPLFVYGAAGTGKSLMVRAAVRRIAGEIGATRTTLSVTAEAFSKGLVRAIRENDLSAFRGRMLAADVFVLEEAHRLRGRPRTQREFLSILRYHIERNRPVILTSRHPPNAIFMLDEALRSYFLSGRLLRVADYPIPSRIAILESLAKRFARPVPIATIERLATRVTGTFDRQVRYLEKIAAFAALLQQPATIETLAERFPELAGLGEFDVDMGAVIERVAKEFGTTAEDIASNRKLRTVVIARHLVVYIATEVFNLKARRVMRHLGGLSPSTTAYARKNVERRRREDPLFDARVRQLLDDIKTGQRMLF